jgi:hypothetical protein
MTRPWLLAVIVPAGTALATASVFRISLIEPFTGFAMLLVAMSATGLATWWATTALHVRYRVACCIASVVVLFAVSKSLGTRMATSAVRAEVPLLLRELELRGAGKVPNLFDINGSRYFRRVSVGRGPTGEGIRARFGLPDGTVVEYVSSAGAWAAESQRECTREVQPGWYRRGRCE